MQNAGQVEEVTSIRCDFSLGNDFFPLSSIGLDHRRKGLWRAAGWLGTEPCKALFHLCFAQGSVKRRIDFEREIGRHAFRAIDAKPSDRVKPG